jgi:alanine racemase
VNDDAPGRWAWVHIDLDAITHNVGRLRATIAPSGLWAVVKANGYGHGAVDVARAALAGGADGLCVALTQEGLDLRAGGIAAPILLLSEQPRADAPDIVRHDLIATVYTTEYVDALAAAARAAGRIDVPVHVKVDTGMQRVGVDPSRVAALIEHVAGRGPTLRVDGIFTHLAVADQPDDPFTTTQLERFDRVLEGLGAAVPPIVHAANSAGALASVEARRSFVRAGIAIYGISPGEGVDHLCSELRPALSLRARVSYVKRVSAGSRISYGLRHTFDRDTTVATVPIGYADGVPRRLWSVGGEVLIGGRRCPIVGVVTMDQLMVDCGPEATVARGDEVVLIGTQRGPGGIEQIRAEDWAEALDTIGYEIVCGIGPRVPRRTGPSIGAW